MLSLRMWGNRHSRLLHQWSAKHAPDQTKGLMPLVGVIEGGSEGSDVVRAHARPQRGCGSELVQRLPGRAQGISICDGRTEACSRVSDFTLGHSLRWAGRQTSQALAETAQPSDPCLEGRGCGLPAETNVNSILISWEDGAPPLPLPLCPRLPVHTHLRALERWWEVGGGVHLSLSLDSQPTQRAPEMLMSSLFSLRRKSLCNAPTLNFGVHWLC